MDMQSPVHLELSKMKPIDMSKMSIQKLTLEEENAFKAETKEVIEGMFTGPVDKTGAGDYAKVVANGKTVATLSNEGYAEMSNGLLHIGTTLPNDGGGPELAQRRAEAIAKATGGTVVKQASAMTQSQWNQRDPIKSMVDFAQMEREGFLDRWKELSGSTAAFNALLTGQEQSA
jgi:hypothetical protein